MDPNRDFPFASNANACFRTITARAINEVFRRYLIVSGITFHGGMQAIAYEWGSPNHQSHGSRSPDDSSQMDMSFVMRDFAGAYPQYPYPVDKMNPLVYPVSGGMEDWAYAGSWDTASSHTCAADGYPTGQLPAGNAT
ncbi:hypothetical protein EON66_06150, partial [archaeon]